MNFTYAYLIASILLLFVWFLLHWSKPTLRKKMLLVSFLTAPLGLTEPFFVPSYWFPPTLFDLARQTGFDIESILFSFAVGGVTAVLYESLLGKSRKSVNAHEMHQGRHRFHRLALLSPFIAFGILYLLFPLNPIYSTILAMTIGAVATWFCRPDLLRAMLTGSILFLMLYFVVFLVGFVWLFPGYVEAVWNLPVISGVLIAGIPVEELLFAASLGAMWSSVYEHFTWYKFS
ncbi:MAG: lycopene cyclase domain-containing protein [Patescibacteria group bacterium]|nr:lycopene cyclase domain-containing protein [Patescibacteria group bacterium]